MYKTILVPLDGSQRAEQILPHVESLALQNKARVVLLQVMEPDVGYIDPYDAIAMLPTPEEIEHRAELIDQYLAGIAGELRQKGIEADRRVVQGPVVEAIISAAESMDADLIAMASHGRSGLARVFYGSVAAGVLQRIDRPLLLVRSHGTT